MQSISNMYVSHLILYLRCKFHDNIPNDCQDIANLLLGYFNLGHPVYPGGNSGLASSYPGGNVSQRVILPCYAGTYIL